jgi:hypothetical protein
VAGFSERARNYVPSRAFREYFGSLGFDLSKKLGSGTTDLLAWFGSLLTEGLGDAPVRAVSLSGGSSKWFFVREACLSLLGLSEDRVLGSPSPFGAISEGLAILPGIKAQLASAKEKMLADKRGFVESLMPRVRSGMDRCADRIAGMVTVELFDGEITPMIRDSVEKGLPIREMEEGILGALDRYAPRLEKVMGEELTSQAAAIGEALTASVQSWLDAYGLRLEGRLPSDMRKLDLAVVDNGLVGIDPSGTILLGINIVLTGWTSLVAASVCGGSGIHLIAAGPAGLLYGAVGAALLVLMGLTRARTPIENWIKSRSLPRMVGRWLLGEDKILRAREKFKIDFTAKIEQSYSGLVDDLAGKLDEAIRREIDLLGVINVF